MSLIDRHSSPATWMAGSHTFSSPVATIGGAQGGPTRYVHPATYTPPEAGLAPIPQKNEQELTRKDLFQVLEYFSQLVVQHFSGRPIRLVVHGGACMLLHEGLYKLSLQQHHMSPNLPRRTTTRDVDYIHRSFVAEMAASGMPDAAARLAECIKGTARKFGLGLDWMNSDADIALPYAFDPSGKPYDPIYMASVQQNNIDLHTVYTAPNKILTLISVTPFWAVSLKLSRYVRWDPGDICLLLRNGVVLSGTHWTPEQVENWLYTQCWATGYSHFDSIKKQQLKERIVHAINQLKIWNEAVGIHADRGQSNRKREKEKEDRDRGASMVPPPIAWAGRTLSAHDAMGGGEVVGGGDSALSSGWTPATGQWPTRDQALRTPPRPPNWNVVDWADGKLSPPGSGSDREKNKDVPRSRAASRSRAPSGAGPEIFIPDSGDEGDEWLQGNDTGVSYRGPWIYMNPNHAPNAKRPPSRQRSPDPYNGLYGPPPKGKGLDNLGTTLGGALNALDYGPQPHDSRSGHNRTQSHVVPTSYHDYHDSDHDRKAALRHAQAEKMRKKKEKDRKRTKEIEKARNSKWGPRWFGGDALAGSGSDIDGNGEESEGSTDQDDIDTDGRAREARDGKTTSNGNKDLHRHRNQPHKTNGWAHNSYSVPHAATSGAASLHPPAHVQPSASRPGSRNASPSRMKKRPPPLPISPPPVIPSAAFQHAAAPANPVRPGHSTHAPARLGAAERAQFQFEQQQRDYHHQLAKQSHQPTVKEVAQQAVHVYAQRHAQTSRGTGPWAQPHMEPAVVGNHHQPWYHQQQHHHQSQRPPQRLQIYQ